MKKKVVAVCDKCDGHIPIKPDKEFSDECPSCHGKPSDMFGKVMVLEIWERK